MSDKYSDSYWDDLEAKIPTWDEKDRSGRRELYKKRIENCFKNCTDQDKRAERFELYDELEGWVVDLHPEWIYGRIASHLRVSPFIQEEIYEKRRRLHQEESEWLRKRRRKIERDKGKRKPKVDYSAEDYPSLEIDPVETEEVDEVKGVGGITTFDDEGDSTTRVIGYGPGVPLERDKLENELLSDLFHFLITREKNELIVYELLESISSAFLSKGLTTTAIQQRIRRHPN